MNEWMNGFNQQQQHLMAVAPISKCMYVPHTSHQFNSIQKKTLIQVFWLMASDNWLNINITTNNQVVRLIFLFDLIPSMIYSTKATFNCHCQWRRWYYASINANDDHNTSVGGSDGGGLLFAILSHDMMAESIFFFAFFLSCCCII